jgi:hypothetical protein
MYARPRNLVVTKTHPAMAAGAQSVERALAILRAPVKTLAECGDPASLTCAIQELFADRGVAAHVDIWTLARSGKRQALCFVRTDPAGKAQQLAGMPGLTWIGK